MNTASQNKAGPKIPFARNEAGSMTVLNLFFIMVMAIFAGIAIDMANLISARTQLQVAADTAAHAALYTRETSDAEASRIVAIDIAHDIMPTSRYGDVLRSENISFGDWDRDTQTFTIDETSDNGVLVVTDRLSANANPVSSFLMQFVGFDEWDVVTPAVFETYIPSCMREGMVADGAVDVTTGNTYLSGFCIHSNTYVELNNGNDFQDGVIVSLPNESDLVLPSDGFDTNIGLQAALRDNKYRLRILDRINEIIAGVQDPSSPHYRSYITSSVPIYIDRTKKIDAFWVEGRIHIVDCSSMTQKTSASAGATMREGILVTDCQLMFPDNVTFEDAVIASSNTTSGYAISAAESFTLGRNDSCATGGDAQIVSLGGVKFASAVSFYGSQIITAQDIMFTSDALGVEGVSIIAGGDISGTTDSVMSFCNGAGMDNNFFVWFFRLAT